VQGQLLLVDALSPIQDAHCGVTHEAMPAWRAKPEKRRVGKAGLPEWRSLVAELAERAGPLLAGESTPNNWR